MCRLKLKSKNTTAIVKARKTSPPIGPGFTFVASKEVGDGNGSVEFPANELKNLNIYAPRKPVKRSSSSTIAPMREKASSKSSVGQICAILSIGTANQIPFGSI